MSSAVDPARTTTTRSAAASATAPASALGAALAGPLVSTQWLADHLGADDLVVLDAGVVPVTGPDGRVGYASGRDRHQESRIPGARFADLLDPFSDADAEHPFTRPTAEAFAAAVTALGIGPDSTVVVYDAAVGQWAARLWWLFRSFGHESVAVLDGGAVAWTAEERPVTSGPAVAPEAARTPFAAVPQPGFWSGRSDVERILDGERPGTLICGTPPKDFAARHIPGSISTPAVRLVDRGTNTVLPPQALRELFADVLASDAPIVAYCGAGIAAAADALALAVLGRHDVTVYDGSLAEWVADPDAPVASLAA